jgi:hypothetical protein
MRYADQKGECMKKILSLVLGIVLAGFSSPASVNDTSSKVNFYGSLNGQDIENITISGLTDHIYFYNKPKVENRLDHDKTDPKHDRTAKSLSEIKSISLPGGKRIFSKYGNQEYIEVLLTNHDGKEHTYLVEKNRMVSGKLPKGEGKRDVFFDALESVDIKGEVCGGKQTTF